MQSVDLIVEMPPVAVSVTEVALPVVQAELSLLHLADLEQVVDRLGADHRVVVLLLLVVSLRVDLQSGMRLKYRGENSFESSGKGILPRRI